MDYQPFVPDLKDTVSRVRGYVPPENVGPGNVGWTTPYGTVEKGNIDLNNRPKVPNPNGGYSTVDSVNFTEKDGTEVLIPLVVGNAILKPRDAWKHYKQTGEHLGKFNSRAAAEAYAQKLHEDQAIQYGEE
jgi:hypothetical protein